MRRNKLQEKTVCSCELCKHSNDFDMPVALIESIKAHKLTLFAGAGVSTENSAVYKDSFYDWIAADLEAGSSEQKSLPQLLTAFCAQPNGRRKLLTKIKKRIDYVRSFPELYRAATRFHRELATLFQIEDIFTTNWDDFFEVESGAVPYVNGEDFALWDVPGRKVFKIHGSINNLGSIVATSEDYVQCLAKLSRGALGGFLKATLATKTLLFVGYSLTDDDFREIYNVISADMDGLQPHAYFVTIDENAGQKLCDLDLTVIRADAVSFLKRIKEHLENTSCWLPDTHYFGLDILYELVEEIHSKLFETDITKYPTIGYTLAYQDGLLHALERITAMRKTGEYSHSHRVMQMAQLYLEKKREKLSRRQYWDVSYIEGYVNGLIWFSMPPEKRVKPPIYFMYGLLDHPKGKRAFFKLLARAEKIHKSAYKQAKKNFIKATGGAKGIGLHHPPFV